MLRKLINRLSIDRYLNEALHELSRYEGSIDLGYAVKKLKKYDDGILRQMQALGMIIKERITIDVQNKIIRFDLIENSMFTGYFLNKIEGYDGKLTLIYEQNWVPITPQARELETKLPQILINGVQEMKELAEKQ